MPSIKDQKANANPVLPTGLFMACRYDHPVQCQCLLRLTTRVYCLLTGFAGGASRASVAVPQLLPLKVEASGDPHHKQHHGNLDERAQHGCDGLVTACAKNSRAGGKSQLEVVASSSEGQGHGFRKAQLQEAG